MIPAPPVHPQADAEKLVTALSASGVVGLWNWDMQTALIYGDANFARMYGISIEQSQAGLLFEQVMPLFHPDDAPLIAREIQRVFDTDEEFSHEYRVVNSNTATRWVSARGRIVRDADGKATQFTGT